MTTFDEEWEQRWNNARCVKEFLENRFSKQTEKTYGLSFPFHCGPRWAQIAYDRLVDNNFMYLSPMFNPENSIGSFANEQQVHNTGFSGQSSKVHPFALNVLDEQLSDCPSPLRVMKIRIKAYPLPKDIHGALPKPIAFDSNDMTTSIQRYQVIPHWACALFACHRLSCLTYEEGAPYFPLTFAFGNYVDPRTWDSNQPMDLILIQEDIRAQGGVTLSEFIEHLAQRYRDRTISDIEIARVLDSIVDQTLLAIRTMSQISIIHNDLHASNIMIAPTNATYYEIHGHEERVVRMTHGVTVRIIDFDWATVGIQGRVVAMSSMMLDMASGRDVRIMPHNCVDPRRDALQFLFSLEASLWNNFNNATEKRIALCNLVGERLKRLRDLPLQSVLFTASERTVLLLQATLGQFCEAMIERFQDPNDPFGGIDNHPSFVCKRTLVPVSVQYMITGHPGMRVGPTYSDGIRWCFDSDSMVPEEKMFCRAKELIPEHEQRRSHAFLVNVTFTPEDVEYELRVRGLV